MAKEIKKGAKAVNKNTAKKVTKNTKTKKEVKVNKTEKVETKNDSTILFMIVGGCIGLIVSYIFFEIYWIGVGLGAGTLIGVLASAAYEYMLTRKNTK